YPVSAEERCDSPVCRRVSFMYSQLYAHRQLSEDMHANIHELFGVCHLAASEQILQTVLAGHLVDAQGRDVYLPHPERLALPLLLIHGADNACYLPNSSRRTLAWLQEHNDPALYSRHEFAGYGHLDCIFGEYAAADVFPVILAHLEQTA
ncbi:MAG: hypothetical protein KIT69_08020, partial [Propionibacteriaceae bacterium]|nr:hypothetical protein [Propionibacteriaceae bacterium]